MIVKTKFHCKNGSKRGGPARGYSINPLYNSITPTTWIDTFIAGKWYDGEYETWSWEDGYRINGGWRRYWVVNEQGEKEEISKPFMNVIFDMDLGEVRNAKIDNILGDDLQKEG